MMNELSLKQKDVRNPDQEDMSRLAESLSQGHVGLSDSMYDEMSGGIGKVLAKSGTSSVAEFPSFQSSDCVFGLADDTGSMMPRLSTLLSGTTDENEEMSFSSTHSQAQSADGARHHERCQEPAAPRVPEAPQHSTYHPQHPSHKDCQNPRVVQKLCSVPTVLC